MKKVLALLLSLMMVMCMMPSMAFAETVKTDLKDAEITLSTPSAVYTGVRIDPGVTVKVNNEIVPSSEIEISYKNESNSQDASIPINVGTYTVNVEAKKNSEKYQGQIEKKSAFKITQKTITDLIFIAPDTVKENTPIKDLEFTIKHGNKTLQKGTDYSVSSITEAQSVVKGAQDIKISGIGNYSGERIIRVIGGEDIATKYEIANISSVEYDGTAKRPNFIVQNKTTGEILSSSNYDVEYKDNVNVSDPSKIIVTGKGNYAGTIEATFPITKRSILKTSISAIDNTIINSKPNIEIKDGSKTLKEDIDYRLTFSDIEKVGIATVYIDGIGNYDGQISKSFYVRKPLDKNAFTVLKTSFEYTGNNIRPQVIASVASKYREGYDYKIIDADNSKVGTYTAKIVGIGDYGGVALTITYTIIPKNISSYDTTVSLPDSVIYDGKKVEPYVSVVTAGRTLVKDVDYSISYLNNDKIGTATVFIYGKGNYTGSVYKTFKILGKSIETASATLSNYSYSYTGLEHKPTVTVYDGTKRLTSGVDYTVEYKNNKNCGSASVIITGKGSYYGTKTLTFDIIGKDQTITTNYTYYTKYLTSSDFNLGAKTDGDGTLTYVSNDPKVASVNEKGVVTINGTGIAYITVSSKDDVKYNPGKKTVTVTVKPLKPVIKVTSPVKKQVKVQITKVKGATKYQINYGRMGKYYNKYITHVDNGYSTVSTIIGNRTSGKNYFIKVRAYKTLEDGTKVWGNWTTIRKVKSK